jgi:hypothetical protein
MTTLVLLTLLLQLSPKDQSEIRKAIELRAIEENEKGSREIWSERGPRIYHVQSVEGISPDVATADAEGNRPGTFPDRRDYVFILARANGQWKIVRRMEVLRRPAPVRIQPLTTR